MLRVCIVTVALLLTSCQRAQESNDAPALMVSSSSDSVDVVSKIVSRGVQLPSKVIEGHYIEYSRGDPSAGFGIGPTDYISYLSLTVPPESISSWTANFKRLKQSDVPSYGAPNCECTWWVKSDDFSTLEFFEPTGLSRRIHGWIAVSKQAGKIYLHDYTM